MKHQTLVDELAFTLVLKPRRPYEDLKVKIEEECGKDYFRKVLNKAFDTMFSTKYERCSSCKGDGCGRCDRLGIVSYVYRTNSIKFMEE